MQARSFLRGIAILTLVGTNACSSSTGASNFDDQQSGVGSKKGDGSGDSSSSDVFNDKSAAPTSSNGCSDGAKFVYVVSDQMGLYKFNPAALEFTEIGTLACKDSTSPNSMAVDRSGTAWVNYASGNIFKVSTTDASCQDSGFDSSQTDTPKFGMAFASNSSGSSDETLYLVGVDDSNKRYRGTGLAKLDMNTLKLTHIGDFSDGLQNFGAELTGTGDARLFGFVTSGTTSGTTLAQLEKDSGATPTDGQASLAGVEVGTAFAFSFWGGDFWFYTAQNKQSSKVTQYKASGDKSVTVVVPNVGFDIVGAGVSTCAPVAPPK